VSITSAVGMGRANKPQDVGAIQKLLNGHIRRVPGATPLKEDRLFGGQTASAIKGFQKAMGMGAPDGVVDVGGRTLQTLQQRPEVFRMETRTNRSALAQSGTSAGNSEGSAANLDRRARINRVAVMHNNSKAWAFAVAKGDFAANTNKCNKFVIDVIREAGAAAVVMGRQPLAAEWAHPGTRIPGWRLIDQGEAPQAGDVAAYALSGGGARYSGHTGLIVDLGSGQLTNMSAHEDSVYPIAGQFENNPATRYRRYTGE